MQIFYDLVSGLFLPKSLDVPSVVYRNDKEQVGEAMQTWKDD